MSNLTSISLFAGGGISTIGLAQAGFECIGAIEYNPHPQHGAEHVIAEWCAKNVTKNVICRPVQDVDYRQFAGVTLLQASPPCPSFSQAKSGGAETKEDIQCAEAVARAIRDSCPRLVIIENVSAYQRSASFKLICDTLDDCGYWWKAETLNANDFGVPQSRVRLILRAALGAMVPPLLSKPGGGGGWYAAVEDILPEFPESKFADWQIERLPVNVQSVLIDSKNAGQEFGKRHRTADEPAFTIGVIDRPSHLPRAFIADLSNPRGNGITVRMADEPMTTILAKAMRRPSDAPRAFLVDCVERDQMTVRMDAEPSHTITASCMRRPINTPKAYVVSITVRGLARWQTIPDSYEFPKDNRLAGRIIGNGWPSEHARRTALSLMEAL